MRESSEVQYGYNDVATMVLTCVDAFYAVWSPCVYSTCTQSAATAGSPASS